MRSQTYQKPQLGTVGKAAAHLGELFPLRPHPVGRCIPVGCQL